MPPLAVGYMPSSLPQFDDDVTLLTIATVPGNKHYTPIDKFSPLQKIAAWDLVVSLGFKSQMLPPALLRHKVHPSYVRKKDYRKKHQEYSNPVLAGILYMKQTMEDVFTFYHDADPTLLSYKTPNQGTQAILDAISAVQNYRTVKLLMSVHPVDKINYLALLHGYDMQKPVR
ncbi:hypothetical protein SCHPADRAFT_896643 [Schizopora paradoxa]|uniref:Uncharacterized protein n=1 Tax=Schizopora paradoxa TaxID=27342 RepID=A0A0H2QZP2_9AGAM|nr:hypothetical protein SCHPADRAFT_896643 [Schizopora paradoxa]